jgi:hypothetical protein
MIRVISQTLILLLILILLSSAALWFLSGHSTLAFDPLPKALGTGTTVGVRLFNPMACDACRW